MLINKKYPKAWKTLAIVGLFMIILTGSRLLWIHNFYAVDQPKIVNGVLDLRNWDAAKEGHTLTLDGQWEFYPHLFIIDDPIKAMNSTPRMLKVPGGWNDSMEQDKSSPYGYGSYRLQILTNPEYDYTYSIRVPSVRSSSELYVNGRLLAHSGQPANNEKDYVSKNLPYSASFTAGDSDIIEIVVQAANFKDFRDSGIVRSVKFGSEQANTNETRLSITMQQLVAIVFLMHAIYAVILYLAGPRDKNLLYSSLLIISVMFMNLLGSEEKILSYWFPINYDMGFKLVHLAMIGISYALLLFVEQQISPFFKKISRWYIVFCIIAIVLVVFLSVQDLLIIQPYYYLLMFIAVLLSLWSMLQTAIKQIKDSVAFLLAFIALASNYFWWALYLIKGISIVYYPWDLIVATACFASVWFKSYFQEHLETKKLAKKLQQADKLKNEFLANTSHELRNPLHSILNLSQAVLEREGHTLHKKSVRDMENVLSVGRRMSLMLNELLDVMSLKQNATRLQLQSFSMQTIVTGVFDMLYLLAEGKNVRLVNRIPEHFPQVFADENRVIQIVYNLVHNAVKFTDKGEVSIRGSIKDGKACIEITDTGIGMDGATLRRVFDPYEQANPRRSIIEGGLGLGLSISKQLVELHGGTLQVHSFPGKGTKFMFFLQLADITSSEQNMQPEIAVTVDSGETSWTSASSALGSASHLQPQQQINRPSILVVDDDPVNLNVLESILTVERYDMTCVTSGQQAMEVLECKDWDLVISDVMMPYMSGYELTRKIRSRFTLTELPILLLTARSQPEDIENGFLSGANDYVTKPVDAMEIRSRVRALTIVKQTVRERLQMEAAWLQAQIQPHFLFNTLNAVIALSETDLNKMRDLLDVLGSFLRHKFQFNHLDELVPLEEELNIVRSYLYIEQVRFEERLHVTWEMDECTELKIPLLTIQPLVENAIKHSIMKHSRGGNIVIRISNNNMYTEISIQDDGDGIDEAIIHQSLEIGAKAGSGVGLINTDLRLKRHFGTGLQIKSTLGAGTKVSFKVPRK